MSRPGRTLLIVALVVLAGCGGGGGDGGDTGGTEMETTGNEAPGGQPGGETTAPNGPGDGGTSTTGTTAPGGPGTDEPTGGTQTPTATPQAPDTLDSPPGVTLTEGEVTDPAALVDGHVSTMTERSGTQYLGWRETDTEDRWLWIGGYGPGGETVEIRNESGTYNVWTDGDRATYRFENESTTTRTVATGDADERELARRTVARTETQLDTYFTIGTWEVEGRTARDGRAVFILNLTERNLAGLIATGFEGENRDLLGLSGTAYVTEDGLVTEMAVNAEFRRARESDSYVERFRLTTQNVGSTAADPPEWYTDSPRLDAEYVEVGRAVKLTHSEGTALRFNTGLEVYREGATRPDGVVTTDSRFETGDTLYVYAISEGGAPSFRLTEDPSGIPDDAVDLSARGSIRVEATLDGVRLVYATDDDES